MKIEKLKIKKSEQKQQLTSREEVNRKEIDKLKEKTCPQLFSKAISD